MDKKQERASRVGICGEEMAKSKSFKICPSVYDALIEFSIKKGYLTSQVVNWAIKEFIARHEDD